MKQKKSIPDKIVKDILVNAFSAFPEKYREMDGTLVQKIKLMSKEIEDLKIELRELRTENFNLRGDNHTMERELEVINFLDRFS